MTEQTPTSISLRKYAKTKQMERKNQLRLNVQKNPVTPNPKIQNEQKQQMTSPLSSPEMDLKTLNPQSTAANFKKIYSDTKNSSSYSGHIQEIANQISSYRYEIDKNNIF